MSVPPLSAPNLKKKSRRRGTCLLRLLWTSKSLLGLSISASSVCEIGKSLCRHLDVWRLRLFCSSKWKDNGLMSLFCLLWIQSIRDYATCTLFPCLLRRHPRVGDQNILGRGSCNHRHGNMIRACSSVFPCFWSSYSLISCQKTAVSSRVSAFASALLVHRTAVRLAYVFCQNSQIV